MTTYCKCGDAATRFCNDDGDELQEPCCDECWIFQCMNFDDLFSSGALIPVQGVDTDTWAQAFNQGYDAFLAGPGVNPYEKDTSEYNFWNDSFDCAGQVEQEKDAEKGVFNV